MSKIVFMGTPDFSVPSLKKLIETQEVVGVVTQPDRPAGRGKQLRPSPIKVVAQEANIPIYQPKSLRKKAAADPIRTWNSDVIVVVAFGQILRPHLLQLPQHGCINVHASLLPRWRGASPIQHAILSGDAETGVCLMQMDVGLDTGPVYVCQSVTPTTTETAASLHDKLAQAGAELTGQYLDDILQGKIPAKAQDEAGSTYAPMISKADGRLEWRDTAVNLDRRIRAMTPWPGAFSSLNGKTIKIKEARLADGKLPTGKPGQVVSYDRGTAVLTGNGGIHLQTIQLEGKKAMAVADFLRGRPDFIGAVLGTE